MKKALQIPKFKNQDEEFEFFSQLDLSDYFEVSDVREVSFPNLKPTSQSISIRLPVFLLNQIKEKANSMGVPYQSFIKTQLSQMISKV